MRSNCDLRCETFCVPIRLPPTMQATSSVCPGGVGEGATPIVAAQQPIAPSLTMESGHASWSTFVLTSQSFPAPDGNAGVGRLSQLPNPGSFMRLRGPATPTVPPERPSEHGRSKHLVARHAPKTLYVSTHRSPQLN
jgi:hypothetical protein